MKRSCLVLGLMLLATPCRAATFFEIGNAPTVSFGWQNPSVALSLGMSANWRKVEVSLPGAFDFPFTEEVSVVVLSPAASALFFLNQERKAQGFLEMRATKGLPIVSESQSKLFYKESNDDWTLTAGGGLRSALAEHLSVGGAAEASFTFRTLPSFVAHTDLFASTGFRVFLQYHL